MIDEKISWSSYPKKMLNIIKEEESLNRLRGETMNENLKSVKLAQGDLNLAIDSLIRQFNKLHNGNRELYEKFEVPINLIIENADKSLNELSGEVLDALEGLAKLIETYLEKTND